MFQQDKKPGIFQQGLFTVDPNMTPDQIARKRQVIAQMVNKPTAQYAGQGIAQMLSGALGGYKRRKLDGVESEGIAGAKDAYTDALSSSDRAKRLEALNNPFLSGEQRGIIQGEMQRQDRLEAEQRARAAAAARSGAAASRAAAADQQKARARQAIAAAMQGTAVPTGAAMGPTMEAAQAGATSGGDLNSLQTSYAPPTQQSIIQSLIGNQDVPLSTINSILDFLPQEPEAPEPTAGMREYELAASQGFDGGFLDYKQALAEAGRTQNTITNTVGGAQPGPRIGTIPQGFSAVPDPADPSGFRMVPIGGGDAQLERAANAAKEANKATDEKLKIGTTLSSINLNLGEISDGGLPVTGPIGDFRRTGLGRAVTGSDAFDFGNRTNQITDSAALAEIQNMRDNSKTGGAVGALTDGERVAIGNAVTALNNSTSAKEYTRAATAYKKLALDYAYGEGMWTENPDGEILPAAPLTTGAGLPVGTQAQGGLLGSTDLPPPPEGFSTEEWQQFWDVMPEEDKALFR